MLLAGSSVVTVSGETISTLSLGASASAGVRFNTDGTVDKLVNGSPTQIDAATDWVRPTEHAPGSFEIMAHVDAGNLDAGDAVDTWLALTTPRSWSVIDATQGVDPETATITVSIRFGGTVLASGQYSLSANRDVP